MPRTSPNEHRDAERGSRYQLAGWFRLCLADLFLCGSFYSQIRRPGPISFPVLWLSLVGSCGRLFVFIERENRLPRGVGMAMQER